MRPDTPKINQHVTYYKTTTRKPRPAIITAAAGNTLSLRVGHGAETYTGVTKRSTHAGTNVWQKV